jgi:hypothetical protein
MPNWADENGRYWWTPPDGHWLNSVEIPHAPVINYNDCNCDCCVYYRKSKKKNTTSRLKRRLKE